MSRLRRWLVISEVAIAVVLCVGAGLLAQTFWKLAHVELGYRPEGVLTARISLPREGYANAADVQRLADRLLSRLETLPGAHRAGFGRSRGPERRHRRRSRVRFDPIRNRK